jgi:hypothetical protein
VSNAPAIRDNNTATEDLQKQYYRVLAHTHTLSPDDEMLRILEAMGILALVTRHTPKEIAEERERMREMLDLHLQFIDKSQQKMLQYVHLIERRLAELPCEIETGLNPKEIAKILGESLRQQFVQSGISNTVGTFQTTATVMGNVQKQLTGVMRELADPHSGIASQVESANRQIAYSLKERTKTLDSLLHEFKTDLLQIWIPIAAGATLLIGLFAGMAIQRYRDIPAAASPCSAATTLQRSERAYAKSSNSASKSVGSRLS